MPISTPTQIGAFAPILTSTTTLTSGSVSPSANALVLVFVAHRWSDGAGPGNVASVTSEFATGGWTIASGNSATNNLEEFGTADIRGVWAWAITTGTPGSGTVTVNLSNAHGQGKGFLILEVASGFDATTPIGQTKVVGAASGDTLSGDLDSAPATASMLLMGFVGGAAAADATTTPATGWTLTDTAAYGFNLRHGTQYRTSTTSTAFGVTWGSSATLGIALNALEIVEAASGATLSSPTSTSITQTTATIGCTSDSDTGTLYAVVTTSATPPSAAQVEAGQDHTGSAAVFAANDATVTIGANTFAATGLTADTTYHTYFVQDEGTSEYSNVLAGTFDTLAVNVGFRISAIQAPNGSPIGNVDPVSVAIWNNAASAHGAVADTVVADAAIVSSVLEVTHAGTITNDVLVDIQYSSGDPAVLNSVRGVATLIDLDA